MGSGCPELMCLSPDGDTVAPPNGGSVAPPDGGTVASPNGDSVPPPNGGTVAFIAADVVVESVPLTESSCMPLSLIHI